MELKIINTKNAEAGKISLPQQFSEEIRPDLIKRAVLAIQSHKRQPYGAMEEAGERHSVDISKQRRDYRGQYGIGISRVPRKVMSRRGTRMAWVGANVPGMVGGRKAHPAKPGKIWAQKLNDNERRKAIRSAMAATMNKEIVESRGHLIPGNYPFIIDTDFESIGKTKDAKAVLISLGFEAELSRAEKKTFRAGSGKNRGRPYKKKKSLLLVVSHDCPLVNAARNIPGIDVITAESLNAELLAPGTDIGRVALFTKKAVEKIHKDNLFINKEKLPKAKEHKEKKAEKLEMTEEAIEHIKKEKKDEKPAKAHPAKKEQKEKVEHTEHKEHKEPVEHHAHKEAVKKHTEKKEE